MAYSSLLSEFYDEAIRILKPGYLLCPTEFFPTGSTPKIEYNPKIKIVKQDHMQGLIYAGRGALKALYLKA